MEKDFVNYMGHLWIEVDGDSATIGINDDGIDEITEITKVVLPDENESVTPDEVVGEIETQDGVLNLYAPVDGSIIEINSAVIESPNLILEDNMGEGWLFRIQAEDGEDLQEMLTGHRRGKKKKKSSEDSDDDYDYGDGDDD